MTLAQSQFSTTNYMVPSNGQTHCVVYNGTASAVPTLIDWRQFALDAQPFQPQGVFIDNSRGTVPLVLVVQPINFTITVAAGTTSQTQFPAPAGQTMTVTGDPGNTVSMYFVDFPVLPSGMSAQITNVPTVIVSGTVETDTTPMASGNSLPYRTQEFTPAADYKSGSITGAATTLILTPTAASENLRKLTVSLTGNVSLAAAGVLTVTVTLNGAQVFKKGVYLPVAAPVAPTPEFSIINLDFPNVSLLAAAGTLVITLSAALATGQADVNAYFAAQ